MDYSSCVYMKALDTLAKQVHNDNHSMVNCKNSEDDFMILDKPVVPISSLDKATITHTHDMVSNLVMVEIIEEGNHSEIVFQNSLCRQIVSGCFKLRVDLSSLNNLMDLFNKSLVKNPASIDAHTD
ncbi:hypothetical protein BYT27DRAFT_7249071 [Phlegmacium glaucopus]|nr:hypothetical protein BYT27DRAFT_7249071 [Phlegmacium glaucopus]